MKATELIKALQHIVETEGDLDVDISVAKQKGVTQHQCIVAEAKYIEIETYEEPTKARISIRDWPY
jgi:hypothetical protein